MPGQVDRCQIAYAIVDSAHAFVESQPYSVYASGDGSRPRAQGNAAYLQEDRPPSSKLVGRECSASHHAHELRLKLPTRVQQCSRWGNCGVSC